MISRLRQAKTESHKEMVYRETARILWKEIENTVKAVLRYMDGEVLRDMNGYQDDSISIDSFKIPNYADKFSELIYLLTLFLDGKEINDLLTQLISAFENIDGFLSVLSEEHMSTELNEKYLIFLRSKEIAEELRVINSFARMTKNEEKEDKSKTTDEGENTKEETESKEQRVNCVKRIQFLEAAQVLGYDGDIDRLNAIADECIDINNEHFNKGLRNFISKNVINSVRFKYLVRYGKPENIRKIASNRKIVDFVLKDIPDEQITRYYNSCKGTRMSFFEEMRGELAERIIELKIEDFYKIPVGNELTNKEKEDKEKKKNIIRLYLTVVYQFYKNLVYVNSRYFLAFHCAERDGLIVDPDEYSELAIKEDMAKFAREWYEKERHSERVKEYLKEDFAHSDTWAIRRYRDGVEHLNVIRKASDYIDGIKEFSSYFEIYHYLIQRHLKAQFLYDSNTIGEKTQALIITKEQLNPKTYEYLCFAETYGVYRKDFVKALNVPFAYNLVRFKNLSIECLFDRNAFRPNEEE